MLIDYSFLEPFKLPSDCQYFDIEAHWDGLEPIYESDNVKLACRVEYNSLLIARWLVDGKCYPLELHKNFKYPEFFDETDWRTEQPEKPYYKWTCSESCHWISNVNLLVAMFYQPEREWRLIKSREHSTVWDGETTIFETQFLALGIPVEETINIINNSKIGATEYTVGRIPWHLDELEAEIKAVATYI
jgi:hypothetical protein